MGNGEGVLITDLGVELEDDDLLERFEYRRPRTGEDIELDDERGDTGSGG